MIGDVIELEVGNFAHGGHCVARIDGRVVFVRHTLPGERIRARVTGSGGGGKFLRADAIEILEASPDRVTPPCSFAGVCGGCDWQHASLTAQRRGKESIVRELLRKNVSDEILESFTVHAVDGDVDGLGWRTRVRFAVDAEGHAGLRPHRSHDVLTIDRCLIAHPAITALDITAEVWPQAREVLAVAPSSGEALAQADPRHTGTRVLEKAAGREWKVDFTGFWQVHPGAADALVNVVGDFAQPATGEHILDLYSGVGLFAGAFAENVGVGGRIDAVEVDAGACANARRNLHDLPFVHLHHADVLEWLRVKAIKRADIVILDPPRTGCGPAVVKAIVRLRPRVIVYVACDPAPLARDLAAFAEHGWKVDEIIGLDMFPMTQHLECVVRLSRHESAAEPT